jgi:hypothetical protein
MYIYIEGSEKVGEVGSWKIIPGYPGMLVLSSGKYE